MGADMTVNLDVSNVKIIQSFIPDEQEQISKETEPNFSEGSGNFQLSYENVRSKNTIQRTILPKNSAICTSPEGVALEDKMHAEVSDMSDSLKPIPENTKSICAKIDVEEGNNTKISRETKGVHKPLNCNAALKKIIKSNEKNQVHENFERMNYLYQCSSLLAGMIKPVHGLECEARAQGHYKRQKLELTDSKDDSAVLNKILPSTNEHLEVVSAFNTSDQKLDSFSDSRASPGRTCKSCEIDAKSKEPTLESDGGRLEAPNSTADNSLYPELMSATGSVCRGIGRKCLLRLSHRIKRELCQGCNTPLLPSVTASVRTAVVRCRKELRVRCLTCGVVKRRPCQDVKTLWAERPEARR